jgi:hypothetical protein
MNRFDLEIAYSLGVCWLMVTFVWNNNLLLVGDPFVGIM